MNEDNTKRPIFNGSHPIETGNYHIVTNEILNLSAIVDRWIKNRSPGGIVYGKPRLGKTRAIQYLILYLKHKYGEDLPIFNILCSQHKASENRFYTDLLREIGHSFYSQGRVEQKKERLIKFFIERAESSKLHKVILFMDESQMLIEEDYNLLMDIYNQLDRYFINMTIILVGQDELIHQKRAFITANKKQIIGRFMVHEYKFSGIKTIDDIKTCLEGYDIHSEYPEGSNWSFTRYFFPEAYQDGYRLSNDANLIFECFENVKLNAHITSKFEIPMQYFTLTINNCLNTFGANGKNKYWPNKLDWEEAIQLSGYIEAEIYNNILSGKL